MIASGTGKACAVGRPYHTHANNIHIAYSAHALHLPIDFIAFSDDTGTFESGDVHVFSIYDHNTATVGVIGDDLPGTKEPVDNIL